MSRLRDRMLPKVIPRPLAWMLTFTGAGLAAFFALGLALSPERWWLLFSIALMLYSSSYGIWSLAKTRRPRRPRRPEESGQG